METPKFVPGMLIVHDKNSGFLQSERGGFRSIGVVVGPDMSGMLHSKAYYDLRLELHAKRPLKSTVPVIYLQLSGQHYITENPTSALAVFPSCQIGEPNDITILKTVSKDDLKSNASAVQREITELCLHVEHFKSGGSLVVNAPTFGHVETEDLKKLYEVLSKALPRSGIPRWSLQQEKENPSFGWGFLW